jgi:glycosyltransferase involved in cell wall biosynthesis
MDHCIETLLPGGDAVEILLIDDGSTDDTPAICDRYAAAYPAIVRVIHQENGGHGEGINQGIRNAAGLYFKVVDSDDWVDTAALFRILEFIRSHGNEAAVDMLICNYVYEHITVRKAKPIRYNNVFPRNRVFSWRDTRPFRLSQYLLMHSVIYRTQLLRDCGLVLPKHTFYVDNIFVYQPLPFVKSIYYLNFDFYHYTTGRAGQSVDEKVMIARAEQQVRITKIMIESHNLKEVHAVEKRLVRYMTNYLSMMMGISSILLILEGNKTGLEQKEKLWEYLRSRDTALYNKMHYRALSAITTLSGAPGRRIAVSVYRMAKYIYRFN